MRDLGWNYGDIEFRLLFVEISRVFKLLVSLFRGFVGKIARRSFEWVVGVEIPFPWRLLSFLSREIAVMAEERASPLVVASRTKVEMQWRAFLLLWLPVKVNTSLFLILGFFRSPQGFEVEISGVFERQSSCEVSVSFPLCFDWMLWGHEVEVFGEFERQSSSESNVSSSFWLIECSRFGSCSLYWTLACLCWPSCNGPSRRRASFLFSTGAYRTGKSQTDLPFEGISAVLLDLYVGYQKFFFFKVCSYVWILVWVVLKVEASTNQIADQQMPVYDLRWKILCRVMNVELKVSILSPDDCRIRVLGFLNTMIDYDMFNFLECSFLCS